MGLSVIGCTAYNEAMTGYKDKDSIGSCSVFSDVIILFYQQLG